MDIKRFKRVKELLHQELTEGINEIVKKPDILVSVIDIKLSSNFDYLDLYISIFPFDESTVHLIKRKIPNIQKKLFRDLNLRKTPFLRLRTTDKLEDTERLISTINRVEEELNDREVQDEDRQEGNGSV